MFNRINSTIFSVLFLAVFLLNTFSFENAIIGGVLLGAYLVYFGWELGGVITRTEKAILRWWLGVWVLLSVILLVGSLAYYVSSITAEVIYTMILLTPPILMWATKKAPHAPLFAHIHNLWSAKRHKPPLAVFLIAAIVLVLLALLLATIGGNPITEAVRSVWERLPDVVFVLFTLATLLIFTLLFRGRERALTIGLFAVLMFVFISVVALAFPIGFGFDSFIHKATELHLAEFGTISPKPFYYIGQYALVLFVHHGFLLPVELVDTYLVPILVALLLPFAWYFAAAHIGRKRSVAMMTLIGLFLLPLSSFIVTTPQALANLWTLLIILASVPYLLEKEHPRLRVLGLAALATLFIHPIAGIPAILYFVFLATDPSRTNPRTPITNRITRLALIAFACVVLPLSFVVNGLLNGQALDVDLSALNPLTLLSNLNLTTFFENRFAPLLDFVYLWGQNHLVIIGLIALFAFVTYRVELSRRFRALLIMVLALSVNYLIMTTTIEFTFLIDYERANYAARLIPLLSFFLAPYVILGLSHFFLNLKTQPIVLRASALVLLVGITTSAFYLAYPRTDAYETNRGFNVSQADIDAVYLVDELAQGEPYLALANQSVSAAAIKEIGFVYYADLFFYPIPTGDDLYEVFLKMNESPTREIAQQAVNLIPQHGDVQTLFFLVNNYWWEAARIIETAKTTANDWRSVGDGQVYIFEYNL